MGLAQMYDEVFSGITIDEIRRRIDFFTSTLRLGMMARHSSSYWIWR